MDGGKRSARKKQKEKEVDKDRGTHTSMRVKKPVAVDLSKLDSGTLKRYKRHYKIKTKTGSKAELAQAAERHFASLDVSDSENEILTAFLYALQTRTE